MKTKTPHGSAKALPASSDAGAPKRSRAAPKLYKDRDGRAYRIFAMRIYEDEHDKLASRAVDCDISLGRYIVARALDNPVPTYTDQATAHELRRIGAMMKLLYPKDGNWTNADKRKYWEHMERLTALASAIEEKVA